MPIPDYQTLMRPVLAAFAEQPNSVKNLVPGLAEEFALTTEELEELIPSGTTTTFQNRVHWARTYLSKAGLLQSPRRGFHEITEVGREALRTFPDRIDNSVLKDFSGFEAWRTSSGQADGSQPRTHPVSQNADPETPETPEDLMASAHREIEASLASDLLDAVLTLTPAQFERLVVDLLIAMGYGGGDLARGKQTQLSADGGIDGVINEDELGLDAIYIQAKRYAPDNKVGRPALNAFVGSLTGEGASKGVFVTTSDFSREALDYVARVQHRIVLINGDRLARLMIKHEVGVRPRHAYVIRSVDEDYFSGT